MKLTPDNRMYFWFCMGIVEYKFYILKEKNPAISVVLIFTCTPNKAHMNHIHTVNVCARHKQQCTVPQMSIIIIYNSTWSILIQQIRIKLSGDNLTQKTQKKDPFTSLHKIKANLPHWAWFEILRNGASILILTFFCVY